MNAGSTAAGDGDAALSVLLADDHHLFREGLRRLLEATGEIVVVGEASNGEEAIRLAQQLQPNIVLMDINMPVVDGIRATEAVTRTCPATSVIVLTMFCEDAYAIQAVRAGAKGYLLKNARSEDVLQAVRLAAAGGSAIDPSLAPVLLREYHRLLTRRADDGPRDGALNQRDVTLLRLLTAGYNNRQIATELALAESTVKNNLSTLFHKIGVRDRTQAVLYAFAEGLVSRPMASENPAQSPARRRSATIISDPRGGAPDSCRAWNVDRAGSSMDAKRSPISDRSGDRRSRPGGRGGR